MKLHPCPECDSREVFKREDVAANNGHGPDLLTGLGPWYRSAKMTVVVCRSCGLMRLYASSEARAKLSEAKKWTRV
jgi:hypothetical protein